MIKPTPSDVGRRVLYRSHPNAVPQEGCIVSLSDQYVFVRYDNSAGTDATHRHNLEWTTESVKRSARQGDPVT
jgi:hypothetical protein